MRLHGGGGKLAFAGVVGREGLEDGLCGARRPVEQERGDGKAEGRFHAKHGVPHCTLRRLTMSLGLPMTRHMPVKMAAAPMTRLRVISASVNRALKTTPQSA